MAQCPRLTLTDLRLDLAGKTVLSDITLDLQVRRLGIVGRNGSGKSTLARVISGLIAPDAGSLRLDGIDPARDRHAALNRIGILFQNPDHQIIFPTVQEELSFGLRQQGHGKTETAELVRAMLQRFSKAHWQEAPISTLSQGQKQLVCLMAILLMQPQLIVLDEPFSGLDLAIRGQLMRLFETLPQALVHITHDPDCLAGYDHVLWVHEGRIHRSGHAKTVLPDYLAYMNQAGLGDDLSDLAG
ncbi:ABC transporter ATP-binding protein (plasmid) [Thioclava litoralis]|uniref:ABC transporter ATP-binding protein n=1 Tax=Thioclava litoralis TaxID=3076557 RepID=A0ABZ1E650_9RHOB|nr:ABC transporter ATP-binding protein [Thioclava sp. FTW29]